ncbi:hypothetical protein PVAND_009978 [Polypedilum vanderplanki]|uniref:CRAL-TRIO domain-containing protein n=1 Tax=Polypedilum vanderplanki TaxID=319348 RepID=A0A9J6CFS9_POLVA|nr:hypothetical protein PVAND_009978 [Polypedilum vanderplanki]
MINLKEYNDDIEKFEKYLEGFKIFPSNINKVLLLRYLKMFDFDHIKAKELFEYNLRFRQKYPKLFVKRDFFSVETQSILNTVQFVHIPKFTEDNLQITIMRLNDTDVSKFNIVEMFRYIFITYDAGMTCNSIASGEICVIDCKGYTIRHFLKAIRCMPTLIAALKFPQYALAARIVQNHYINCSPIAVRFLEMIRPFMKKEILEGMHIYTDKYDELYTFIPREYLPLEYGGTYESFDDLFKKSVDFFSTFNDYVRNDANWKLLE